MLYVDRTSLASMTLAEGAANPLNGLVPPTLERWHRAELAKDTLAQLLALQPEALLVDFIDDRFDLLACGAVLVNESLELRQSGLLEHPPLDTARRVPRLGDEAWLFWLAGLERWRQAMQGTALDRCRIILHSCRWAEEMQTPSGRQPLPDDCEILPGQVGSRAAHNELLRRMEAHCMAAFPHVTVLAPPAALRVADAAHRWGPAPFHFVTPYY